MKKNKKKKKEEHLTTCSSKFSKIKIKLIMGANYN